MPLFNNASKAIAFAMKLNAKRRGIQTGSNVVLSPSGTYVIHKTAVVNIADNVTLTRNHKIVADNEARIELGRNVRFAEGAKLFAGPGARICVEDNTYFNHDVSIVALSEVVIGRDCIIGPYSYISDHNHNTALGTLINSQTYDVEPLIIGSDVWLGVGATLLKGARIGNGVVIAARAVVNKEVPENEIWGGLPAKRIGERR